MFNKKKSVLKLEVACFDASRQTLEQVKVLSTTSDVLISAYTSRKLRKVVSLIAFRVIAFVGLRLQLQLQSLENT